MRDWQEAVRSMRSEVGGAVLGNLCFFGWGGEQTIFVCLSHVFFRFEDVEWCSGAFLFRVVWIT